MILKVLFHVHAEWARQPDSMRLATMNEVTQGDHKTKGV